MAKWRWYISITAVREWMRLAGLSGPCEDANPDFVAAQETLGELSLTARLSRAPPNEHGALTYRGKVTLGSRRRRVECYVQTGRREEGRLPQLVWVRLK